MLRPQPKNWTLGTLMWWWVILLEKVLVRSFARADESDARKAFAGDSLDFAMGD